MTPVFNESLRIRETVGSVLAQSLRPSQWIIVDDGSTDGTYEILVEATKAHEWIRCIRRGRSAADTYYSSNVFAIEAGIRAVAIDSFAVVGILDGDLILPAHYFETLLKRLDEQNALGIVSGVYVDRIESNRFEKVLHHPQYTPKGLMVMRRQCFEQIGGLVALRHGYEDTCACVSARMHGWLVRSYDDLIAIHTKPVGRGHSSSRLTARFRLGVGEYAIGSHPVFATLKSLRRCFLERPLVASGLARLAGYWIAMMTREPRQVSKEFVSYLRREQLARIWMSGAPSVEREAVSAQSVGIARVGSARSTDGRPTDRSY